MQIERQFVFFRLKKELRIRNAVIFPNPHFVHFYHVDFPDSKKCSDEHKAANRDDSYISFHSITPKKVYSRTRPTIVSLSDGYVQ